MQQSYKIRLSKSWKVNKIFNKEQKENDSAKTHTCEINGISLFKLLKKKGKCEISSLTKEK